MAASGWLAVVGVCALAAMVPGPSLAVVLRHALTSGRAAGLAAAWSHAAGIGLYALATVTGLAVWLRQYPATERLITLAGAVYLVWLGVRSLSQARRAAAPAFGAAPPSQVGVASAMRDGLLIALTNPKVAGFFLALFAPFTGAASGHAPMFGLVAIPVAVDGLWYSLIAGLATQPSSLAWLRTRAAFMQAATGVVLLGFALLAVGRVVSGS